MIISIVSRIPLVALAALILMGTGQLSAQQLISPHDVVGRENCSQCHVQEQKAWEQSSHNKNAWNNLDHPKAGEFAKAIGVTDVKGESACTQCHGTQQKIEDKFQVLQGNTCESCHGGAGGDNGWLEKHYRFSEGQDAATKDMPALLELRKAETADHRKARDQACSSSGMNRSGDVLSIAKNCLSCHLVANEKLLEAGHPISSKFELAEWSAGEVRHNFLLDSKTNAAAPSNWLGKTRNVTGRTVDGRKRLLMLAGKLADLEISLTIRGAVTSTKRGSLGDEVNDRILDIKDDLEDDWELPGLEPVMEAIKDLSKKSLKDVTEGDGQTYVGVAKAVAAASEEFFQEYPDGTNLPDSVKIRSKVKGEPYQPK